MVTECTYCGQDIFDHDPLFLAEFESGVRVQDKQFCNYACLAEFIEEEDFTDGGTCDIDRRPMKDSRFDCHE